ncbi:MAG: M23 family metallopeptidase [Caldilinea sp.]|nr:M23 family metallopeptidase [Caldilinea sp.]MDW8441746.1 M23 family metallopeptidase [Caldilineaceae bacterium]
MSTRSLRHLHFASQHEPEGVFLIYPIETTEAIVLQGWGAHSTYHSMFTYNGIPLKGHPGLDLAAPPGAPILAVDQGRVSEIGRDAFGLGLYIKIEHRWGESLYAQLGQVLVESGKNVERGERIAAASLPPQKNAIHLHFAIRIFPYNRFDGWGGFSDPTPYLYVSELTLLSELEGDESDLAEGNFPPMAIEKPGARRP